MKPLMGLAGALILLGCSANKAETRDNPDSANMSRSVATQSAALPLRKHFACLPKEAAIIAAHRGVSKGEGLAENSRSGLQALIDKGIMVAEVDIVGLKDGTHVLFHDGVWEEKTTGSGPVAASNSDVLEKILLRDTDGELTSDRPIQLQDALDLAKDRIYLEIDFKSSAKYKYVIEAIRQAGMADQVILIAYNNNQARRMAELAPEMMLSVGVSGEGDLGSLEAQGVNRKNINAWIGRGPYDAGVVQMLDEADIPILAWPGRNYVDETAGPAALIVSDYALKYDPIIGLSSEGRKSYEACLGANG